MSAPPLPCPRCSTPVTGVKHTLRDQPFAVPCCCPVAYEMDGPQVRLHAVAGRAPAVNPVIRPARRRSDQDRRATAA